MIVLQQCYLLHSPLHEQHKAGYQIVRTLCRFLNPIAKSNTQVSSITSDVVGSRSGLALYGLPINYGAVTRVRVVSLGFRIL